MWESLMESELLGQPPPLPTIGASILDEENRMERNWIAISASLTPEQPQLLRSVCEKLGP